MERAGYVKSKQPIGKPNDKNLLDPAAYFALMKHEAENEVKKE